MEVNDLTNNMQLSPMLSIPPTVISYLRRVEIKLTDSLLLPNTTYRIDLGNALVDNRESTPYQNFAYTFSTGSYFDSLSLHGYITDAATGKADTNALIMLYPDTDPDSAIVKSKPLYAVKTDAKGHFSIQSLPQKKFRIYAVKDVNKNYLYDYGEEKVGFLNQPVIPSMEADTFYQLNMFKEVKDSAVSASTNDSLPAEKSQRDRFAGDRGKTDRKAANSETDYRVNVDTNNKDIRSFDLTNPLKITCTRPIAELDTDKVYLSYDNEGIEVEAIKNVIADSAQLTIHTQWIGNKLYTLRLVKGWATDTSGNEFPPGRYSFKTKSEDDYATLKIHIPPEFRTDRYVLYVFFNTDSIYRKAVSDSIVTLHMLQPGAYGMHIIEDKNGNGQWDAGVLLAHKQPEKVISNATDITLKAGWENEVDFIPLHLYPAKKGPEDSEEQNPDIKKEE